MNRQEFDSVRNIANLHEERITQAINKISYKFPLDIIKVQEFTEGDLFAIEMLTSRFSKLQDYLGNTVFDVFLENEGKTISTWTLIDKLNELEKYLIIDDAHIWRDMRKARNFLTHEYPNEPAISAASLNVIYNFVPELLKVKAKIFEKMEQSYI